MKTNITRVGVSLCVMAVILFSAVLNVHATIIAYDGFADVGSVDGHLPGATSYVTYPQSTDGLTNDSLHAQSPISIGFADTDAWFVTNSVILSNLFFQVQKGGLTYTNFAPMTSGNVRIVNESNTAPLKHATRDAITTDTSDIQWVAMLVYFNSSPSTAVWHQNFIVTLEYGEPGYPDGGDGAWVPAQFGVRISDGKAFYVTETGGSKQNALTESALGAGTHLFLLKFDHGYSGDSRYDDVTMWVDPVLTEDPNSLTGGLAAVSIMRSDLGGGLHAFDNITISGAPKSGNWITFDEFIITDDYADLYTPDARKSFQTVEATYIRSSSGTVNYNDDGQLKIGPTTGDIMRGLIEFDISAIPSVDQVTSASLFLTTYTGDQGINNVGSPGDLTTFNVYNYAYDIDETTATWNTPDADGNDPTAGGTTSPGALLATGALDVEKRGIRVMFSDTNAFCNAVENALDNDGILRLLVTGADETVGVHNFVRFSDERDATPLLYRPELQISHLFVPLKGTVILVH